VNEASKNRSSYRTAVAAALGDYAAAGGHFQFESSRSAEVPLELRFSLRDPALYDRLLLERMMASDPALQATP